MRLEAPLIALARTFAEILNERPDLHMRYAVYDLPGGCTPCVVVAEPSSEGTYVTVFLALHPERLTSDLLHLSPSEVLLRYEPIEVCDAFITGMIEHDGTFTTVRTACTERGKSDLLLAANVLQSRKTKCLAIGEAAN
jgi:hypothetical protein